MHIIRMDRCIMPNHQKLYAINKGATGMKRKFLKLTAMSLATITTLLNATTVLANSEINQSLEKTIDLSYSLDSTAQTQSGQISLEELDRIAREYISNDQSLSISEKESKLVQLDKIYEEQYAKTNDSSFRAASASTSSFLGISYVKPGPGRIRIYLSPNAIKIALVMGVGSYAASIIQTLGLTGAPAFIISNLVLAIINSGAATKSGATLHGWNNYKSWNFRLGNTLNG